MSQNTKPPNHEKYCALGRYVHLLIYNSGTTRVTQFYSRHDSPEEAEAVALALNALSK